jgi:hypothetical protein
VCPDPLCHGEDERAVAHVEPEGTTHQPTIGVTGEGIIRIYAKSGR